MSLSSILFLSLLTSLFSSSHSSPPFPLNKASLWNNPTSFFGDSIALPPQEWAMSPEISPAEAPAPSSGEDSSPESTFPWPFQPESAAPPTTRKGGMALINSNPAVSSPAGGVDFATVRPSTSSAAGEPTVMIEVLSFHAAFHFMAFLIPLLL